MADGARIDFAALFSSYRWSCQEFENSLQSILEKYGIKFSIQASQNGDGLYRELPGIVASEEDPMQIAREIITDRKSLHLYVCRPSDRGRLASIIRHEFSVVRFTQSYTYDDIGDLGSHASQRAFDAYFIAFRAPQNRYGGCKPWKGLMKVEVISEPPWTPRFHARSTDTSGPNEDLETFQAEDRDLEEDRQLRGGNSFQDVSHALTRLVARDPWLSQKIPGSADVLASFLKVHNTYSRKSLYETLSRYLDVDSMRDTYLELEREYDMDNLPISIYILDRMLFGESENPSQVPGPAYSDDLIDEPQNKKEAHLYKLKIIFSTIAWLEALFPETYDKPLRGAKFDPSLDGRLRGISNGLSSPKREASLMAKQWRTLAISKNGLIKGRKDTYDRIHELIDSFKMPPGDMPSELWPPLGPRVEV
ncbi:RelA/SpoT [Penicillium chermesinum]|uniref:RelA/SpoT n=1 Tax=Penicillium chermesinum TaxID=63820 RepID=A0A9W9NV52_9EURO|nr:RelA/SpoT [Penicillium chermesinum]KAJ5226391.1 RelA/SpoT [Penicillium chermesinum]